MADHVIAELMVMCALVPVALMAHTVKQASNSQCNMSHIISTAIRYKTKVNE